MKQKVFVVVLIIVALATLFVGCNSSKDLDGMTKIVYELEGGIYMNCELPIEQYYDFEEGSSNLIYSPETLSRKSVERAGYEFTGWYRTKTQNGDSVTYSDKWDFETDKVTTEGITLYAGWEPVIKFSYRVCYVDASGETVELGKYIVKAGDEFNDRKDYASKRSGDYTAYVFKNNGIQNEGYYLDKALTQPVAGYKHPGGDVDTCIDVYAKYIEGKWEIVRTANELATAKSKNIYLDADIDMGGKTLVFGTYSKNFEGNGHTISNFTMPYNAGKNDLKEDIDGTGSKKSVYVTLFDKLDGATIKNVNFVGGKVTIKGGMTGIENIYLAPLATNIVNSTVDNVSIAIEYKVESYPTSFDESNFTIFGESGYAKQENSTITALTATVVLADDEK